MSLHDYDGADALHAAVAQALHDASARALDARGHAWLALAGGRTPLPAYRAFASAPLPWPRVAVVPTDERCVPAGHPASNGVALAAAFAGAADVDVLPLADPSGDPVASLALARQAMAGRREPFDAVVLGMGEDAHIASLFPGAAGLAAALAPDASDDVVRIDPVPLPVEAPFPRTSLTLARLLRAREVHLVVAGEGKRAALERALADPDPLRHPVAALLHAGAPALHLHWAA